MAKEKKTNIGDLDYGTDAWQDAWAALSPQDQQAVMGSANDPTAAFYDDEPFDFGMQGYAMDPMFQQLMAGNAGGVALPYYTAAGKLEKYDLPQEQGRVNLMQDNATSMADLVLAAMSGGPGAIDPQSFAPVVTRPTERIATPGLDRVKQYSQGTGAKAYIARKIMAGATDDEAIADLFNFIDAPENSSTATDEDRKTRQMIIDSLPSAFKTGQVVPPSGRGQQAGTRTSQDTRDLFNESSLATDAREMYEKAYEDQSKIDVGWEDPDKPGTYYTEAPTSEDSAAMKKFRNLGLPSPFAAYNDPEYLQMAYDTMAPNLESDMMRTAEESAAAQADQQRIGRETRGPIDRNINTQRLYEENFQPAGFQAPPNELQNRLNNIPGAPPSAPSSKTLMPGQPDDRTGTPARQQNFMNNINQAAQGGLASTYRPDQMSEFAPRGIVNPQGGFDFGGAHPAEQQALVNRLLNTVGGMPFGGGSQRGTKTVALNADTAKQSQKQADAARKKYSQANDRSYNAMNATTASMAQAAQALAMANANARAGNTPFIDVANQRRLGQRMMGVRA